MRKPDLQQHSVRTMPDWIEFKQRYLIRFWSPTPALLAAGVLSAYYFGITGTFWAVTGEFTRWGGKILQWFGYHPEQWGYFKLIHLEGSPLDRVDGMMVFGMFAGCLSAALWANNVKLRLPQHPIRVVQALVGGIITGFGARLAMGCNLAAFFTGIPQFSLHAWIFAVTTAAGTWFGVRFTMLPVFRTPVKLQKVCAARQLESDPAKAARRFRLGMLVFAAFVLWATARMFVTPRLGLAALFGVAFGLIVERAQICFTSAFRDLWLTGRTHMAKAILLGIAVSTIGVYSYAQRGVPTITLWAGPNAAIGGLLFGFGIVVAGGCETGWMCRAMEGQVHYWLVGIGSIAGGTILAAVWDSLAPALATSYPKINLLVALGPEGGLVATYLMLALSAAAILWWERVFFEKRKAAQSPAYPESMEFSKETS
jgi:uncharacterized membrane protein YedE/YeeE